MVTMFQVWVCHDFNKILILTCSSTEIQWGATSGPAVCHQSMNGWMNKQTSSRSRFGLVGVLTQTHYEGFDPDSALSSFVLAYRGFGLGLVLRWIFIHVMHIWVETENFRNLVLMAPAGGWAPPAAHLNEPAPRTPSKGSSLETGWKSVFWLMGLGPVGFWLWPLCSSHGLLSVLALNPLGFMVVLIQTCLVSSCTGQDLLGFGLSLVSVCLWSWPSQTDTWNTRSYFWRSTSRHQRTVGGFWSINNKSDKQLINRNCWRLIFCPSTV